MGNVVVLSGPVGAGKTTVAKELLASAAGASAYVEGDRFWPCIVRAPEDQTTAQRFVMISRAMTAAARHFARDGYEVILDFSIPPWFIDALCALLQGKPFDYVVLRPSEAVCAARAAARLEGAVADYTRYRHLYAAFDSAERFTVADDDAGPQQLAERIREGLAAGRFRVER